MLFLARFKADTGWQSLITRIERRRTEDHVDPRIHARHARAWQACNHKAAEMDPVSTPGPRQTAAGAIIQRAALSPESLRSAEIVRMQQTLGNRAVGALLNRPTSSRPVIQAKLTVNAPGDEYEREADRVADAVMRMPAMRRAELEEDEAPEVMTKPLASSIQREGMNDEEIEKAEPIVITKPGGARQRAGSFEVGEEFEQGLRMSRGGGHPLPSSLQQELETKFGADLSSIRIHTDAHADQLNRSLHAQAFTTGRDIFFRHGAYDPRSRSGQELIAHELTHVVQQVGEQIQPKERGKQQSGSRINPAKSIQVSRHSVTSDLIQPKYLDDPEGAIAGLQKLGADLKVHSGKPYYDGGLVRSLFIALRAWAQKGDQKELQTGGECIKKIRQGVAQNVEELKKEKTLRGFLEILKDLDKDIASQSAAEKETGAAEEKKGVAEEKKRPAEQERIPGPAGVQVEELSKDVRDLTFTDRLKDEWLKAHNAARSQRRIPPLAWDEGLAKQAQDWAMSLITPVREGNYKGFKATHSVPGTEGQNIADWGSEKSSPGMGEESKPLTSDFIRAMPQEVVQKWMGEESAYKSHGGREVHAELRFLPILPKEPRWGHYTQVLWPQTTKVGGCIAVYRKVLQRWRDNRERLIQLKVVAVCSYYPGGNEMRSPDGT